MEENMVPAAELSCNPDQLVCVKQARKQLSIRQGFYPMPQGKFSSSTPLSVLQLCIAPENAETCGKSDPVAKNTDCPPTLYFWPRVECHPFSPSLASSSAVNFF